MLRVYARLPWRILLLFHLFRLLAVFKRLFRFTATPIVSDSYARKFLEIEELIVEFKTGIVESFDTLLISCQWLNE